MKKNDAGDFAVLYIEPDDERATVFQVIAGQKKPVIILLTEQTAVFQRPDDFSSLKHVKRQLDLPIVFVIPQSGHIAQLAARSGFPVYLSMDALADALSIGQLARSRTLNKFPTRPAPENAPGGQVEQTIPTSEANFSPHNQYPIRTEPLTTSSSSHTVANSAYASTETMRPVRGTEQIEQRQTTPLQAGRQGNISPRVSKPLTPRTSKPLRASVPLRSSKPLVSSTTPRISQPLSSTTTSRTSKPLAQTAAPRVSQPLSPAPSLTPEPRRSTVVQPVTPPVQPTPPPQQASRRRPTLLLLLTIALVLGIVGSFIILPHAFHTSAPAATPPVIAGHIAFTGSGQLSETSSQGIADQVTVDLSQLPPPAAHRSYYAWLLGDRTQSDPQALLLGTLQVNNGNSHLFYQGDNKHTNLLQTMSRFLVTEEDSAVTPIAPSPDQNSWRYSAEFSSTPINVPDNTKHFSYLDHLRHLLASDPTLDALELPGGLNTWCYRNIAKVLEWTTSTRDKWEETKDAQFVRDQASRALEYLDGDTFVYQDLPANAPLLVNERLARIGLVQVNGPNQEPPSYLSHIVHHLNGLLEAENATPVLRKQVAALVSAMNNVEQWLTQVRHDTQQLVKMSDDQLQQSATLSTLSDMIENANRAYVGQADPSTNTMRQGASWIYTQMQALATLNVTRISSNTHSSPNPGAPETGQDRAFILPGVKK